MGSVENALNYTVATLCKFQDFDSVEKETFDHLVDLTKNFILNLGEVMNSNTERIARKKQKSSRLSSKDFEVIMNNSLTQTGLTENGIDGLVEWYNLHINNQFKKTEIISFEALGDGENFGIKSRIKDENNKLEKTYNFGKAETAQDMDESSNEFAPEMTSNDLASDLVSFVGTSLSSFPSSDYSRLDVLLPQLDDS